MSFQKMIRATFYTTVTGMIRKALRCLPGQGGAYGKVIEWAQRIVFDGAYFLQSGDEIAGQRVMNAIDSLSRGGLPCLAHLAGTIATLIVAGDRNDRAQGILSGDAIGIEWGPLAKADAGRVWQLARRPAMSAARPTNLIMFRQAA